MRRVAGVITALLLLAGGLLLPGSAAHAKGAGVAEITGPGLQRPIQLDDAELDANRLASVSGLTQVMWGEEWFPAHTDVPRGSIEDGRPRGRLGPRYVVTYQWMVGQDEDLQYLYEPVRQRVYPFARGGAVAHVPAGQDLFGEPVGSGWYRAGAPLRDLLIASGVPEPRRA